MDKQTFPDITIERSRRKSLIMQITHDRTILVKAPLLTPKLVIDQFVAKHTDWIENKLAKLAARPVHSTGAYRDGDSLLFLGKQVTLEMGPYTEIKVKDGKLLFPKALMFRAEKELQAWYIKQGKELITSQVEKYAKEMNASYTGLTFSDTKSKWGSCSHDNRLQFSWRLIMAPILVLNYVIVHELAHTIEKNHSRAFWRLVEKFNPSYRQSRKWLHDAGHALHF